MTSVSFDQMVRKVMDDHSFERNPFFRDLQNGEMSKAIFVSTQRQFYHAVVHFTSPLGLVAAAIPTYAERVNIIKNLWEEHGEGDLSLTHGATFTELLRRLTKEQVIVTPTAEEAVVLFNESLDGICKDSHWTRSVATIGIIERMFADISNFIGNAIVERGWLQKEEMIHYSLHRDLDVVHAEDFFCLVRKHWDSPGMRPQIEEGLRLGALTFMNLYQGLLEREKSR